MSIQQMREALALMTPAQFTKMALELRTTALEARYAHSHAFANVLTQQAHVFAQRARETEARLNTQ